MESVFINMTSDYSERNILQLLADSTVFTIRPRPLLLVAESREDITERESDQQNWDFLGVTPKEESD